MSENAPSRDDVPTGAVQDIAARIGSRNLLIAILVMPVLFIAALVAIIAVAPDKPRADPGDEPRREAPREPPREADAAEPRVVAAPPANERVEALSMSQGRVAMVMRAGDGRARLVVIDVETGETALDLPLESAPEK